MSPSPVNLFTMSVCESFFSPISMAPFTKGFDSCQLLSSIKVVNVSKFAALLSSAKVPFSRQSRNEPTGENQMIIVEVTGPGSRHGASYLGGVSLHQVTGNFSSRL